ncbi:hypothetical protein DH2020_023498 [Rehmannia glutinosa]|uniref:Uncharacterized protein n=1 Tax=Rehmannia glutinosa TaxID=99300 RepID=A0ABR0W7N7_REHGL
MEVAIIDWKSIDSRFVKDELYEHINAPKWVDFSAPDDPVDDEAWFCRPSCDHPKTTNSFPIYRDATLKKRGINQPFALSNKDTKHYMVVEDGENHNPNFSTPLNHKAKFGKEAIKSSNEKKQINDTIKKNERTPKLRSTLSARNLFSGGDILDKVAEFCNDLKKLATRARDKENAEDVDVKKQGAQDHVDENLGVLNDKEKERKPLLEMSKEKSEVMGMTGSKGQLRRKKRNDDGENTPICVDVKNIKGQEAESLSQIRTCPPTPQCFSAGHGHPKSTTPKPFRTRPLNEERGILQEVKQMNKEINKVEREEKIANQDARSLDVFWFLKPCTLSS